MQQAARVADTTAFMLDGELVEHGADRRDLHQPERPPHRGVRHREVRVIAWRRADALPASELPSSRTQALGGLDLVVEQLDRTLEALEHQDVELAADGHRRRRPRRRALPRGPPGHPVAARAAGAGRGRPAARRGAAARDQARRAHGRPVREHRQADPALGPRAAGARRRCSSTLLRDGRAARARRSCRPSAASPMRDVDAGRGPRAPGPRDQPPQPRDLPRWPSRSATTPTRASGRCT